MFFASGRKVFLMKTEIVIVGAGLSGLSLASYLEKAGRAYLVVEARDRVGGRIKSMREGGGAFDLGPSWFWPGQPRIVALAQSLQLEIFDQYSDGDLCYEDETGAVHRVAGSSAMEGSRRIKGGMAALVERLAASLPPECIRLNAAVTHVARGKGVTLLSGDVIEASHVVLAVPPRVAAQLAFDPPQTPAEKQSMESIPTWMGAHAKFVATYDRPFWREAGLSGDAMSRRGPLAEIHDASAPEGSPAALFGFVGAPAAHRQDQQTAIEHAAVEQLGRLFGDLALSPNRVALQDWAFEKETVSPLDHSPLHFHPAYGLPDELTGLWDGELHLCSTEVANEYGGYLEGALAAAHETSIRLAD